MRRICILLLVAICSACAMTNQNKQASSAKIAQDLWDNPMPTPMFLEGLETQLSSTGQLFQSCIHVSQFEIWEPGDEGDEVYLNTSRTVVLDVDGEPEGRNSLDVTAIATLITRRDKSGNVLGSHGGSIAICFDLNDLKSGLHYAMLTFESTSGRVYEYRWAFDLIDNENSDPSVKYSDK